MFGSRDELTIEGYRIPWLIWIQILVLFLLLLLIFLLLCFSFFPSDLLDTITTSSSASPSTLGVFMPLTFNSDKQIPKHNDHVSDRLQDSQVQQNQSIKGEITTNTGRRIVREASVGNSTDYMISLHPCNYFRLAKLAFLKCFGLDSLSENSLNSEKKKER